MAPRRHTVMVLGAGASVSNAQGFRPKQPRDHPPLDTNFFEKAARHDADRLLPIRTRARELGQPDIASAARPVSLEQYLGRLYFELANSRSEADLRHYYTLVRFYAAELLTTTNWMIGRRGSLSNVLRIALDLSDKVSIVSFNHDLLVEDALSELPNAYRGAWCLNHVYGGDPWDSEPIAVAGAATFADGCPGSRNRHVHVYKLHGSLNWVFKTSNQYPSAEFIRGGRERSLGLWTNRRLTPWEHQVRFHTKSGLGRNSWYLWPLVVPPIYEKHGFIHGRLRDVWVEAEQALLDADHVMFWGYSFPQADLHARYFFQAIAQKNEAIRQPVLINPDPRAHAALWDIVRPGYVEQYHDVTDYLRRAAQTR